MSKVSIFDQGWIDLVFEGRNQSYGAYQLRRQDSKTTLKALFSGIALMVTIAGVPAILNHMAPRVTADEDNKVIPYIEPTIFKVREIVQPPAPKPATPQPAAAAPASTAPTTRFKPFVASTTPEPIELPTIATVLATNPGATTSAGTGQPAITINPGNGPVGGNGTATGATGTGTDNVETSVDVMPQFPGGIQKFYEQIGRKFRTPDVESLSTLKVYVSFVVERDGTMTNIKVARDPGHGMAEEAIRVLKSIKTKWEPGMIKGAKVRTAYNLPITVNLK